MENIIYYYTNKISLFEEETIRVFYNKEEQLALYVRISKVIKKVFFMILFLLPIIYYYMITKKQRI